MATDWPLVGVTVALVFATSGLVWATLLLVGEQRLTRRVLENTMDETRQARTLSVRPRLALDVEMVDPRLGEVAIKNVGRGAAFDVVLELAFEPVGDRRSWQAPTFEPGEVHLFHFPGGLRGAAMPNSAEDGTIVSAAGTYRDLYGESFTMDDSVDVAAWWATVEAAEEQFPRAPVVNALKKIAQAVRELSDPPSVG